jgi:hypothetical protein
MMEVDTDDDMIESSALNDARARGQPPDILSPNLTSSRLTSSERSPSTTKHVAKASVRSTTEYQPLLSDSGNLSDDQLDADFVHLSCNNFDSDPEFSAFVKQVEQAIDSGVLPQRIFEGSSGSYFAKNSENVNIKEKNMSLKTRNCSKINKLKFLLFVENGCRF